VAQYWDGVAAPTFDYGNIDARVLRPFSESHPAVAHDWLQNEAEQEFAVNPGYRPGSRDKRHHALMKLENLFGWDFSKRHYKLVK
jgi:hypothetical protein